MSEALDYLVKRLEQLLSSPNLKPVGRSEILYLKKIRFILKMFSCHSIRLQALEAYVRRDLSSASNKEFRGSQDLSYLLQRLQHFLLRLETGGEICVGFDAEARTLLERLTSISRNQLQVVSVVGMAGLGKTTLAKKVYNDPFVVYHFYVRGWVNFYQAYQKKDLLLGILSSFMELSDEVCRMSANNLAEMLYKKLKGKRYLIVVDDVWSNEGWESIRKSFPNDNNGSRILITTRLRDVALHAQHDRDPLLLRFLTEEESWELFRKKVFSNRIYSDIRLNLIGKEIVKKCHGLPLTIVVLASLMKNKYTIEYWTRVCERVSSCNFSNPKRFINTLALSYNNLPQHLKLCLLYFGAFPKDYEISVQKLIWLWIAEGFICQVEGKCLEDVAEGYLIDLIQRSLIVVTTKGCNGRMKTCRIHGLLRDLCLRKVKEENFSPKFYMHQKHFCFCPRGVSPFSSCPPTNSRCVCSITTDDIESSVSAHPCCTLELSETIPKELSMTWESSNNLRALDFSSVQLRIFPSELLLLVSLRYLEVKFTEGSPPESVSDLVSLETLIMSSKNNIIIPENMWNMVNMRHLRIRSGENLVRYSSSTEVRNLLENLQTISHISPSGSCDCILARTPNLRKLGLCGRLVSKLGDLRHPNLGLLNRLEALKLLNTTPMSGPGEAKLSNSIMFPETLRRLTMSRTFLEWKDVWIFEMIPNLEVLKLKMHAFIGDEWETSDGVFRRLKFLKLEALDVVSWRASGYHFPLLQHLVVHHCQNLNEIPACFGDIPTLESIEISGCTDFAANSVRNIQEKEQNNGNDLLKILIIPTARSTPSKLNVEMVSPTCYQ